jgi:hypothetical protein
MCVDYIECSRRKNLPRKHYGVCMACRHARTCTLYQGWLDDELGGPKRKVLGPDGLEKKVRKRRSDAGVKRGPVVPGPVEIGAI